MQTVEARLMHVVQKFIKNTRFVGIQRIRKQVLDRISVHFTRRKTFVGYTPAGKISVMLLQCNV